MDVPLCRTKGTAALLVPCGTVPKENEVGVRVMPAAVLETPFPVKVADCGLPAALS